MGIVSDSGPILSFARAHRLDLLHEVVGELSIPEAIYEEIVVRGGGKPGAEEVRQGSWIRRGQVQDRSFVDQLPQRLALGEREAIALAKELGAGLLVDEQGARREAQRLGIPLFGSLKVLQEAKDRSIIQEIKPVLDELIAAGMYVSDTLYEEFLHEVGQA